MQKANSCIAKPLRAGRMVGVEGLVPRSRLGRHCGTVRAASVEEIEDPWVGQFTSSVGTLESPDGMRGLNDSCRASLASLRIPTPRNEEYRFTDLSPLTGASLYVPDAPSNEVLADLLADRTLDGEEAVRVVVVDGLVRSVDGPIPTGAYVGGVDRAPSDVLRFSLGTQSRTRGGPFATLNGASARDCIVIYVPEECAFTAPIHIIYVSSAADAGNLAFSAPRSLVFLEAGSSAEVVEEFVAVPGSAGVHASFSVTEIELDDKSSLTHKFVELDGEKGINLKSTLVSQGVESTYSLTEVRLGGDLTRHDVGIVQLGEQTHTEMKHFLLAGEGQTHDLHTKLKLDHPDGTANQVHKCIAASDSSRGVFDGNVKVNRMAQRTDAGQISRNLLLTPRATVNVKPNLQIVADDVKCTHGCAVSDLEAEQLFYLQARGIDPASARKMLVYSFGGEVMQELNDKSLVKRVTEQATGMLDIVFS
jgi:Fe-S cluster assembly protein SufD